MSTQRSRSAPATEAVIGGGTRIRGRLQGQGGLRVEGHLEGDVSVSGPVTIASGGTLLGDVDAADVNVDGELTGDVRSTGSILIAATAKVRGDLGGSDIALEEGAAFSGRVDADFELPDDMPA